MYVCKIPQGGVGGGGRTFFSQKSTSLYSSLLKGNVKTTNLIIYIFVSR